MPKPMPTQAGDQVRFTFGSGGVGVCGRVQWRVGGGDGASFSNRAEAGVGRAAGQWVVFFFSHVMISCGASPWPATQKATPPSLPPELKSRSWVGCQAHDVTSLSCPTSSTGADALLKHNKNEPVQKEPNPPTPTHKHIRADYKAVKKKVAWRFL